MDQYIPAAEPPRGKRTLSAIGAAAGYLGLYFGIRFAVTMILFVIYVFMGIVAFDGDPETLLRWLMDEKLGEISFIEIIGSTVAFFAAVWVVGLVRDRQKPAWERVGFARDTGFVRFRPVLIPLLIVLGFSLNMFVSLAFDILPIPEDVMNDYADKSSMLGETTMLSVLATAIFAPLSEELIFRGMMISRLRRALPAWAAALIPSVIFGLIHGQIILISYAFLLGLFLSYIRIRARSTAASALLHAAFNGSSFLLPLLPIPDDAPASLVYVLFAVSGIISAVLTLAFVLASGEKTSREEACA